MENELIPDHYQAHTESVGEDKRHEIFVKVENPIEIYSKFCQSQFQVYESLLIPFELL